jgi:hypothetical protein
MCITTTALAKTQTEKNEEKEKKNEKHYYSSFCWVQRESERASEREKERASERNRAREE